MLHEELNNDPMTRAMQEAAQAAYPNEACALIVGVGKKARFIPCTNISSEPRTSFRIAPKEWARAADLGEVVAIWHSHVEVNNKPSDADRAGCEATQVPWLISSIYKQGEKFHHSAPNTFEPSGFLMPYLERPYVFGTFDCYSLVVDYYQREYGIHLEHGQDKRIERWWHQGIDFIGDHYAANGFKVVSDDSWEEGDVLAFAINSPIPNHVAIYVTGDIILHHMVNRLSRRETCGAYWRTHMTHHLRHESKC